MSATPFNTNERLAELESQVNLLVQEVARLKPRESAYIPEGCSVGEGSIVAGDVQLMCSPEKPILIAEEVRIHRKTELLGPVTIEHHAYIGPGCYIRPETTIGVRANLAPRVLLLSDGHEIGGPVRRAGTNRTLPISVGDGAWIGGGAIILGGVSVGAGSIVAAGSVVTHDVPENSIVAGAPARVIRNL